jgi:hypothetical protein
LFEKIVWRFCTKCNGDEGLNMKKKVMKSLVIIAVLGVSVSIVAVNFLGSGTATGTATKPSSFARIGKDASDVPNWGKVKIKSVTVLDKFGREKTVRWSVVGGAGTSRPTIKITPALENGDYVSVGLETSVDGNFGYVGLHLY